MHCTPDCRSQKTHVRVFFDSFFSMRLWLNDTLYYSKSVWRNELELACREQDGTTFRLYSIPESRNAQRYRQTDRRTDDMMMPIAGHTV